MWKNPITWLALCVVLAALAATIFGHVNCVHPGTDALPSAEAVPAPTPMTENELGCVPFLEKRQDGSFTGKVACLPEPQLLEYCRAVVEGKEKRDTL